MLNLKEIISATIESKPNFDKTISGFFALEWDSGLQGETQEAQADGPAPEATPTSTPAHRPDS